MFSQHDGIRICFPDRFPEPLPELMVERFRMSEICRHVRPSSSETQTKALERPST